MSQDQELLPCPFCGGGAKLSGTTAADLGLDGDFGSFCVDCTNEGCTATILLDTPEQAIAAWNTRASDGRVRELEGALANCCKRLRSCAEAAGNAPFAVDALMAQFEALLPAKAQS